MSIIVSCACGKKFRAKDEHAGKRAKCPSCGHPLSIPHQAAPAQHNATSHERPRQASQTATEDKPRLGVSAESQPANRTEVPAPPTDTVSLTCTSCGLKLVLTSEQLGADPKCSECGSAIEMMRFKCWTCADDIVVLPGSEGEKKVCPDCGTPNLVPVICEEADTDTSELCYFCKQRTSEDACHVQVFMSYECVGPSMCCRGCGAKWNVVADIEDTSPQPVGGSDRGVSTYVPRCPQCGAKEAVPVELPAMPMGRHYHNFRSVGVREHPIGETQRRRMLTLLGVVAVPRCRRCKRIHKSVFALAMSAGGVAGFVAFFYISRHFDISPTKQLGESILAALAAMFLVMAPVGAFLGWLLVCITSKYTADESCAKEQPDVEVLKESGWDVYA